MRRVDEYNTPASAVNNVFFALRPGRLAAGSSSIVSDLIAYVAAAYKRLMRARLTARPSAKLRPASSGWVGRPQLVPPCRLGRRNL